MTGCRSGSVRFGDGDGFATVLAGCARLSPERIKRLVHEFGGRPPEDDPALLVLQAEWTVVPVLDNGGHAFRTPRR
ncbi:hypothetical protein [Streptomyces hokutonensis]|uniref:hypothetical protein n=1 Tax=Streptomyces hokutonensis TaxID=1306990 RepID=UPI0033CB76FC